MRNTNIALTAEQEWTVNDMRLGDLDALWADIQMLPHNGDIISSEEVEQEIVNTPTIDAVPVPCKIGDVVYGIRHYNGKRTVQKGFVSEMFFTKDMKLMIVVKHVCRGFWLDRVFPTYDTAAAAELESRWQQ